MIRPKNTCHTIFIVTLLAMLLLLTGGCAPPPVSDGLQQQVDMLLQIQEEQTRQLAELKQQLAELQTPLATLSQVEAESEAKIETEVEPLVTAGQPAMISTTAILPLPITPSADEIAELSAAAGLYLESFAAIATGRMAEAETGFRAFIDRFPNHEYIGNANYWMAEALLAQQKPQLAETILLEVIDNPQQENKAPAAMARLVIYYRESGAQNNATAMLQMLSNRYPESPELNRLMRSAEPR